MGLDMYAHTTREIVTQEVDFDVDENGIELLHIWHKHWTLHDMMQELYERKGGAHPNFNLSNLLLKLDDLSLIEEDILKNVFTITYGSLYGPSDGWKRSDDLEFIEKARKAIGSGFVVFYHSWM